MDCTEAKGRMEPYASGALAPAERALVEEHLTRCEGCRLEMELVRAIGSSPAPAAQGGANAPEWTLDRIFGAGERLESGAGDAPPSEGAGEAAGSMSAVPAETGGERSDASDFPSDEPRGLVAAPATPEDRGTSAPEDESAFEVSAFDAITAGEAQPAGTAPEPPASRVDLDRLGNEPHATQAMGAAHESAPSERAQPAIEHTPVPSARRQTDPAPRTSWDFEPADAKAPPKPPEGSLFFAEETLERQREIDSRKKGGPFRLVLWGLAALVGVAFLALSAWIALRAREAPEEPGAVALRKAVAPTGTSAPAVPEPQAESPAPETPVPSAPEAEEPASTEVAAGEEGAASAAVETPEPAPEEIAPTPKAAGRGEPAVQAPARPAASRRGGTAAPRPRPRASAPVPAERTQSPAAAARGASVTPSPSGAIPRSPVPAPSTAPPERDLSETADAPESPPDTERPPRGTPPEAPAPTVPRLLRDPAPAEGTDAPASAPAKSAGARAPAPSAETPAPEAATPTIERPIDRIHQATVLAEERGDLSALRQLRSTWKNMIQKSGVGPDRVRAKREYADCLWAIQTLTGRTGDQKAALIAYRDYLLNAPAGGADSRSVGRTRLLEDALSESR